MQTVSHGIYLLSKRKPVTELTTEKELDHTYILQNSNPVVILYTATINRSGRIVNINKKQSRHNMKPNTINWKANKKGKNIFQQDCDQNSMKWSFIDIDEHHNVSVTQLLKSQCHLLLLLSVHCWLNFKDLLSAKLSPLCHCNSKCNMKSWLMDLMVYAIPHKIPPT